MNTNRFGLRAIIIIYPIFNAYSERQKTLLKWYVPYYIPAGILMTVFGVRGAKLSLASPISLVWICLLIFLNSLNRLLFSIYFLFFVIYTHTHSWTYSRKAILSSQLVLLSLSRCCCVVFFFHSFCKLFLTSFFDVFIASSSFLFVLTMCFVNMCVREYEFVCAEVI